jgi:hypothetical protein
MDALPSIIDDIANRADDFLVEKSDRKEARATIAGLLASEYPEVAPKDYAAVVKGVMAILEKEDFFGTEFAGDSWHDSDDDSEE